MLNVMAMDFWFYVTCLQEIQNEGLIINNWYQLLVHIRQNHDKLDTYKIWREDNIIVILV